MMKEPVDFYCVIEQVQKLMNENRLSEAYRLLNTIGLVNICNINPKDYEMLVELRRELTRRMAKALASDTNKL